MGESACWLDRLCPDCAAVLDDAEEVRCPRCGEPLVQALDLDPSEAPQRSEDASLGSEQGDGDVDGT